MKDFRLIRGPSKHLGFVVVGERVLAASSSASPCPALASMQRLLIARRALSASVRDRSYDATLSRLMALQSNDEA